ncbi:hypothetical protein J2I47_12145 [Fibrella sp. HMF5335]|uniref:Uncharacterized protein n=1 Tax=Fibrella rubiginis TaxID=2817060 RepID=A0A939K3F2_9BACT|nr:transporter [Fibrella rubiginis]MBO0937299.1 hypothetical protein [Fibrella rubiginis]
MHRFNKWCIRPTSRWGGLLLGLALLGLVPDGVAGGGWVRKKSTFYGKLRVSSFRTNKYYNLAGELNDQGAQFQQTSLDLYAEYGLSKRLTLILNAPLFRSNKFSTTNAATGFGDVLVEAKYGILTGNFPVAISVGAQLPTGQSRILVADVNRPGSQINLPIGDGELNIWTKAYASIPFSSRGYVSVEVGYNKRTQGFSDQYASTVEVGYKIGPVWTNAVLRRLNSVGVPDTNKGSFVYGEGLEYTAYSLGAAVPITKKTSLTLDYSNMIVPCKNTYSGPIFGLGLSVEM